LRSVATNAYRDAPMDVQLLTKPEDFAALRQLRRLPSLIARRSVFLTRQFDAA
jgi:hypothetical protein